MSSNKESKVVSVLCNFLNPLCLLSSSVYYQLSMIVVGRIEPFLVIYLIVVVRK